MMASAIEKARQMPDDGSGARHRAISEMAQCRIMSFERTSEEWAQ